MLPSCLHDNVHGRAAFGSWGPCNHTAAFANLTNGTGCCGDLPGVCDPCSNTFSCTAPDTTDGFHWGMLVAIFANFCTSIGLALQKTAHNRIHDRRVMVAKSRRVSRYADEQMTKELRGTSGLGGGELALVVEDDDARQVEEAQAEGTPSDGGYTKEPIWWAGILTTIGSEIGNFAAYGDKNTATSVIASLGCVSVISNWLIASFFLGEEKRLRDVFAILLIVIGVILLILFVPKDPQGGTENLLPCPIFFVANYSRAACELPAVWPLGNSFESTYAPGVIVCETRNLNAVGSIYWYMWQPVWLVYVVLACSGWGVIYYTVTRVPTEKPRHVAWDLSLADIAGGFTVCGAVTVSSFLFEKIISEGKLYVALEPLFWFMIALLAVTAVVQVKYLNRALESYDASVVVPTHYVLFALSSIVAPSILYQVNR